MTHQHSQPEKDAGLARARELFDAYGSAAPRCSEEARKLEETLKGDPRYEALYKDALKFDAAIALPPAPKASDSLAEAALAGFDRRRAGDALLSRFGLNSGWNLRRFIPAGAVAALSALGFVSGVATAGAESGSVYETPYYYPQATVSVALDEEDAFWAVD